MIDFKLPTVEMGAYGMVLVSDLWSPTGRCEVGEYDDDEWDDELGTEVAIVYVDNGMVLVPHEWLLALPDSFIPSVPISHAFGGDWLYAVQPDPINAPHLVKVGRSRNVPTRLRQYRTANPYASVVGVRPFADGVDETAILGIAARMLHRVSGEVFEGDVLAFVGKAFPVAA